MAKTTQCHLEEGRCGEINTRYLQTRIDINDTCVYRKCDMFLIYVIDQVTALSLGIGI